MFGLSPLELGVILVIIILVFGSKRLADIGTGMGQAISNFRKSYKDSQAIDVTPGSGASKVDTAGNGEKKKDGVES